MPGIPVDHACERAPHHQEVARPQISVTYDGGQPLDRAGDLGSEAPERIRTVGKPRCDTREVGGRRGGRAVVDGKRPADQGDLPGEPARDPLGSPSGQRLLDDPRGPGSSAASVNGRDERSEEHTSELQSLAYLV